VKLKLFDHLGDIPTDSRSVDNLHCAEVTVICNFIRLRLEAISGKRSRQAIWDLCFATKERRAVHRMWYAMRTNPLLLLLHDVQPRLSLHDDALLVKLSRLVGTRCVIISGWSCSSERLKALLTSVVSHLVGDKRERRKFTRWNVGCYLLAGRQIAMLKTNWLQQGFICFLVFQRRVSTTKASLFIFIYTNIRQVL